MTIPTFGAADVAERLAGLAQIDIRQALREAFAGLHYGSSVQPPQTLTLLPDDAGDCIYYKAVLWDKQLIGVKMSPYLASLGASGQYPVTAWTLLLSGETGQPLLLCDSLALTTARTAATTSLALDYLMPAGARVLAVIGAGAIAREHLRYVVAQHDWSEVRVFAPSLTTHSEPGREKRAQVEAIHANTHFAASAEAAVRGADVVLLCTSSGTPVIDMQWLTERAVVTSISTNVPRAHEIDPVALASLTVCCDYRQTAPLSAGEMLIAQEQHGWDPAHITADLPEFVTGQHAGASQISGRAFFRSTGLGLEDIAIASLLLDAVT